MSQSTALKKTFLLLGGLISSLLWTVAQAYSVTYTLPPQVSITLSNSFGKPLIAQCELHLVSNARHDIAINALRGNGVINGTNINQGQSMVQKVYQIQVIPISASKDAQAQFTNLGPYAIQAVCTGSVR